MTDAAVALADGRVFRGRGFGAPDDADGEAVITTTMTGYQEVCTDPSFRGQIVCMTYPLIGNYGVSPSGDQSRQPWVAGLLVRELSETPNHWRSTGTLAEYLARHGIPGIAGIDTRAFARHVRTVGDTRAVLVRDAAGSDDAALIERARAAPLPGERDVVAEVMASDSETSGPEGGPLVVILDCGVKRNIVDALVRHGARVTVVPYGTSYAAIAALGPAGIVVSPGPGDPANLDHGLDVVRHIVADQVPYFGICLGHQLLARAIGAKTEKLRFGHRGGNHPVLDRATGRVTITSQNHGYRVDAASVPTGAGWRVSLLNLNDDSVEGLANDALPVMTVQFHPEASPGPWDNDDLFGRYMGMVRGDVAR
ncbi:MAG: glutamine-hydrolyzing carbamoyl-phosphate synthase small subunit [Chloroflexia bacterium]|nr:glutamine-hydrolyzing carbamoyl-phosphate synthase small subunit [Chloroflexia bacterium]